jgi:hypothetical protein
VKILYVGGYAVLLTDFVAQTTCVFIFAQFGKKAVPHSSVETEVTASESDITGSPDPFFNDRDKIRVKQQSWTSSEDINTTDMEFEKEASSFQSSQISEVTDTDSSRIWEQFVSQL